MNLDIFFWRSKGAVIHRGVSIDGGPFMTAEGCNFDDAEGGEVFNHKDVLKAFAMEGARGCERCWPDDPAPGSDG